MNSNSSILKILLLGDKEIGKKEFLNQYIKKGFIKSNKEKDNIVTYFENNEYEEHFKIAIKEFSENGDKLTYALKDTNGVFILFDMSDRKSIERLLDYWLIFIRDSTNYKKDIYVFGIHNDKSKPVMTDEKEIDTMIHVSEVKAYFIDLSKDVNAKKVELFSLFNHTFEKSKQNGAKQKDCSIF